MEVIVGSTEGFLDLGPERRALQRPAIVPPPLMDGCGSHANAVHGGFQPQTNQQARGVGADLDTGPDLANARRLLIDVHVEPGFQEMQGGGQAADAAADDGNFHCSTLRHTARPSAQALPRQATWVSGRTSTSLAS